MLALTGSHVLPGSPQVPSRVGAGWPAGAGLVMNHVVPPAAHSRAGDRELTAGAAQSVSSPAWPAEAAAGPGRGPGPTFPAASGPHCARTGEPQVFVLPLEGEASVLGKKQGPRGQGAPATPNPVAVRSPGDSSRAQASRHPQSGLNFWSSEG